jgi:hypothetical protein
MRTFSRQCPKNPLFNEIIFVCKPGDFPDTGNVKPVVLELFSKAMEIIIPPGIHSNGQEVMFDLCLFHRNPVNPNMRIRFILPVTDDLRYSLRTLFDGTLIRFYLDIRSQDSDDEGLNPQLISSFNEFLMRYFYEIGGLYIFTKPFGVAHIPMPFHNVLDYAKLLRESDIRELYTF